MKKRALEFEDSNHKHIAQYRKNYQLFSNRAFTTTSLTELNRCLVKSNFIFVGDFHTFDHCLKNLLRILKLLLHKNKKIVLALEMISSSDSILLETFLNGHLTELEFLDSINLGHSWKFPWTHYRSIYELVKSSPQIEIIGVNTAGTLKKRDHFCADILAKKWHENKDKTFVVLYGEYHIAANKIPKLLKSKIHPKTKITTVHQNLDAPYWKLLKKSQNTFTQWIIKYNPSEFCLLTSPPWMKYESMCYWYENLYDDPDFDLHQYIIENGLKLLSTNTIDNFLFLSSQLISVFKFPLKITNLPINLYDFNKIDYLKKLVQKKYTNPKSKKLLTQLLETQHMLILPGIDKIYCASYSSNKLAKLAGGLLYLEYSKLHKSPIDTVFEQFDILDVFTYFVLYHYSAYFMAKAVNPYLKCNLYVDHLKLSKDSKHSQIVISAFTNPLQLKKTISTLTPLDSFEIAKMIGELIADIHFFNYQQRKYLFKAKQWLKMYLQLPLKIESIMKLITEINKKPSYTQMEKRYY